METKVDIKAELLEISPFLVDISKNMPQGLPNGYFESFSSEILKLAKESSFSVESELASIAPLLNQISKTPVQHLPKGYFTDFTIQSPKEATKIVQLRVVRKWVSYAAAAMIAGVLITAGFVFNNKKSKSFDFEFYSKIDVPAALNQASEDALQDYLNSTASLSGTEHLTIPEEMENINQGNFQQISDEELKEYLNEVGGERVTRKES
ncbi:MAG: hypothetical protein WCP74_02790 [Sphingobacteriia bacterium]|jgi:hypothetical protein